MNLSEQPPLGRSLLTGLLLGLLLMLGACTFVIEPVSESVTNSVTDDVAETGDDEVLLLWEGRTDLADGDPTTCKTLRIMENNQAAFGPCGDTQEIAPSPTLPQWDEIRTRFEPFLFEIDDDFMIFNGTGEIGGPAWQRALVSWAEFTYGELATGRVSASARTVMGWQLGPVSGQPDVCRQLIVLSHGYAYAATVPCDGGQTITSVGGWIESEAWEQFDAWLYGYAPLYQDEGYLGGLGEEPLPQSEIDQLVQWVETVYSRLASSAVAPMAQAPVDGACRQPFQAVQTDAEAAINNVVEEVAQNGLAADAELPWPDGFWDRLVTQLVQAGETYLDTCLDAGQPVAAQPEALSTLAAVARVVPEMSFVLAGDGDFLPAEIRLAQEIAPTTQVLDVDQGPRGLPDDEVILHTQVAYFSRATLFALRGGISILYANTEDGWRGQVIWPVAHFGAPADGYIEWSLDETYMAQQAEWTAAQALQYGPARNVEALPVADEQGRVYLVVTGVAIGPVSDVSELAVWRWDARASDSQSRLALRLAWNQWCGDIPWTLLPDGRIHIAARDAFPEHGCPAVSETLYIAGSDGYVVEESVIQTPVAVYLRNMLARQRNRSLDAVTISGTEAVDWPDACLGVTLPDEMCAQIIVPGHIVTLTVEAGAQTEQYVYHTDGQGYQVRLADAPAPTIGEEIVTWTSPNYDGGCRTAVIGAEGVAFGRCGGVLMSGFFIHPIRTDELAHFVETYASVEGETPTAGIIFAGQGDRTPTAAEIRMLAEWAELVQYEAVAGHSDPEFGRAIQWRQGTPAADRAATGDFPACQELTVYLYGAVYAGPCAGEPVFDSQWMWLDGEQLAQLYAWHTDVEPFTLQTDELTGREGELSLWSLGFTPATEEEQAAIQRFVRSLIDGTAPLFSAAQSDWPVIQPQVSPATSTGDGTVDGAPIQTNVYQLQYPPDATLLQNEWPSVDGVSVPMSNTIAILSPEDYPQNYLLIGAAHDVHGGSKGQQPSLTEFVASTSTCVFITPDAGTLTTIAGVDALAYENVACGPFGGSHYFMVHNGWGYQFIVETAAPYAEIRPAVAAILATWQPLATEN